jgi:hypothetical protein
VEPIDPEIEALLRRSRPTPAADWLQRTEAELLPVRPAARPVWRRPAVRLGSALAAGFASLALVFSLAGVGPLAGQDQEVRARDRCRLVDVVRKERVPVLAVGRHGHLRLAYRVKPVRRTERRCRQG